MFHKDELGQGDGIFAAIGAAFVVGIIFILFMVFGSFTTVGVGEVGIIKHWGAVSDPPEVFSPGLHNKMPFKDDVVIFNTKVVRSDVSKISAASKDGITVTSDLAVNWHIDGANAPRILQTVGADPGNAVLAPAILQSFKDVTGTYAALDMIQKRQEVADKAAETLRAKVEKYFLVIDSVSIVNLEFPQAFDDAIQATQVANQNRAKAQQQQEQAKIDADTALITAQGLANAQKAQATTLTPEYLQLQAILKWNGALPLVNSPASILPFLGTAPNATVSK